MVSITIKKIKGKEYLYLVESIRKGDKVTQKTVKYIGRKRPVLNEELECMKLSYYNNDWILTEFRDELPYTEHHKMKVASGNYKRYMNSLDKMSREKEKQKFLSNFIASSNAIEGVPVDCCGSILLASREGWQALMSLVFRQREAQ